ncbi:MAG: TauD/TfdA family dioxygenase [Alphaproteobacteria bacterium]|nr:TauD/TfdA family dioxygenase [Alphaproteobacteria bacterium]
MSNSDINIVPSGGGVGAFIEGIDLGQDLSDNLVGTLRSALGEHGVLFFRDQDISPEDHIAFAEKFAPININRFFAHADGHPKIAQVLKEPYQKKNIGGGWHTDHTYDIEPAMGSILVARETPPHGGDTMYASTCRAYETLSDGFKAMLKVLKGVHSSRHVFGPQARYVEKGEDTAGRLGNNEAATQDAVHPLIIRHPISGRESIYVNPGFTIGIDGWTDAEAEPFLKILYDHIAKPEHTYRFQWAPGSIAFWDNRASWHYAVNDYHGARRLMHRITVEGEGLAA